MARIVLSHPCKTFRPVVRHAADWMLNRLVGPRLSATLSVRIVFVHGYFQTEGCLGQCDWTHDAFRPKDFIVHADSEMTAIRQVRTLGHELVHVKQFAKNELYDYYGHDTLHRWRDRRVDSSRVKYRRLPWEREAYGTEQELTREWMAAFIEETGRHPLDGFRHRIGKRKKR